MKDARGHGSNGGYSQRKDLMSSKIGIAPGASFNRNLSSAYQPKLVTTSGDRHVAHLRQQLQTAGPGHATSLLQGLKNLLGG